MGIIERLGSFFQGSIPEKSPEENIKDFAKKLVREHPMQTQPGIYELTPILPLFPDLEAFKTACISSQQSYEEIRMGIKSRLENFARQYQYAYAPEIVAWNFDNVYNIQVQEGKPISENDLFENPRHFLWGHESARLHPVTLINEAVLLDEVKPQTKSHTLRLAFIERVAKPQEQTDDNISKAAPEIPPDAIGVNAEIISSAHALNQEASKEQEFQQPVATHDQTKEEKNEKAEAKPDKQEPKLKENIIEETPITNFQCPSCSQTSVVNRHSVYKDARNDLYDSMSLVCLCCSWQRETKLENLSEKWAMEKERKKWEKELEDIRKDDPFLQAAEQNKDIIAKQSFGDHQSPQRRITVTDTRTGEVYGGVYDSIIVRKVDDFIEYCGPGGTVLIPSQFARIENRYKYP